MLLQDRLVTQSSLLAIIYACTRFVGSWGGSRLLISPSAVGNVTGGVINPTKGALAVVSAVRQISAFADACVPSPARGYSLGRGLTC